MEILNWYKSNFESGLKGRYTCLDFIIPILQEYEKNTDWKISTAGYSEKGKAIPVISIGTGSFKILAWSQMHGNENTTTKALFDLFSLLNNKKIFQNEIQQILKKCTFVVIPILNPDGAEKYTRHNANKIDLNRDANNLTQSESVALRNIYNEFKPDLCLNLHDQRSIYGLKATNKPATVSFLAPAADKERSITKERKAAMKYIAMLHSVLKPHILGQIGRYDDSYNENCVGDTFQSLGTPTILFEAGHCINDYTREKTRKYIFLAYWSLLLHVSGLEQSKNNYKDYFKIPENSNNFRDIILRKVLIENKTKPVDIAVQFQEVLQNNKIIFKATIDEIDDLQHLQAYREYTINEENFPNLKKVDKFYTLIEIEEFISIEFNF